MNKLLLLLISILACSKDSPISDRQQNIQKYQCIIDSYDADTATFNRTLWAQYYLPADRCGGMDTIKDIMFLNCNTLRIEHIYYTVNGKKTFVFPFPKTQPEKTDTNFINYNKLP